MSSTAPRGESPVGSLERPPLTQRAVQLLEEFRRRASRGIVCETTGAIARALGVSVDTVRRGLGELIAQGYVEDSGFRRGKARGLRLVDSPQPCTDSPQLPVVAAESPLGVSSAAHPNEAAGAAQRPVGCSPMAADDRRYFDGFEWSPELLADYAGRARAIFERLFFGDVLPKLEEVTPGECDDCRLETPQPRQRYGTFQLCFACAGRRQAVAVKLVSQVTEAERAA